MLTTEFIVTDILVIGSGIAGMMAAIEAKKGGAEVTLVTKGGLGKESSTSRARSFRASYRQSIGEEQVPDYDSKPGKYIEDWPLVRIILGEAPKQIDNLIELGVPMAKVSASAYRPVGSDRTHGGAIVLGALAPIAKDMGIRPVENCTIVGLLKHEGKVVGASGLLSDGRWLSIYAKAVILATGGGAAIAEITTSSREVSGGGYAIALNAGLALKNLEFNQFYPVGLPTPAGEYVHCAPVTLIMKNAVLKNDKGEDIIKKHFGINLQQAMNIIVTTRFDWLSRAVAAEAEDGRVWLDLTGVPPEEWEKLPERNWKQIRATQVDMKVKSVAILPISQQFQGGILINARMQTPMEGLYAAGEVTGGWYVGDGGANPLGSCLSMGAIAGREAVSQVGGMKTPPEKEVADGELQEIRAMTGREGTVKPAEVRDEIRRLFYRHAGPIKSGPSLKEGLEKLQALGEKATDFQCRNAAELKDALEAKSMLLTSKALMKAALLRTESRGNYYRRDFSARDDRNWLRPILISYDQEAKELKVEPGERIEND
ncbi:FAD-dependent oxidoreductase [Chloroflexota bacterium]